MSRSQKSSKPSIDPVVLITLGLVLVTIAAIMIVFPSDSTTVNIANDSGVMSQLVVAFVTGLTTGGLSCLAVQGGLLASSLAHQLEQDYLEQATQRKSSVAKRTYRRRVPVQLYPSCFSWLPNLSPIRYWVLCLVCLART